MIDRPKRVPAPKFLAHSVARMIGRYAMQPRSQAQGTPKRGWRVKQLGDYSVEVYWEPGRKATKPYGADDMLAWAEVLRAIAAYEEDAIAKFRAGKGRRIFVGTRRDERSQWSVQISAQDFMPTREEIEFEQRLMEDIGGS